MTYTQMKTVLNCVVKAVGIQNYTFYPSNIMSGAVEFVAQKGICGYSWKQVYKW